MQVTHIVVNLLAASFVVLSGASAADTPDKAELQKQTIEARASELDKANQHNKNTPAIGTSREKRSMLEGMVILADGKRWTIVPAQSVLSKPKHLAEKFPESPTGSYVQWSEFQRHNSSWLGNFPVTVNTIKGTTPLTDTQRKSLAKSSRVAVATFNNNPVSILPPRAKSSDEN